MQISGRRSGEGVRQVILDRLVRWRVLSICVASRMRIGHAGSL